MNSISANICSELVRGSGSLFQRAQNAAKVRRRCENALIKHFPSTRYYGSKLRLVEWIASTAFGMDFHTVLDAFGGTATVSLLFKAIGKSVTYNDVFLFNNHVARSVLSAESSYFRKADLINFPSQVKSDYGFIAKTFNDVYYLDNENQWLDGAVQLIRRKRDLQFQSDLFYCLFQACLQKRPFNIFHRKNLYIRKNNKRNTKFGNWKTWERSFGELMVRAVKELSKAKAVTQGTAELLMPTDASNLSPGYDLVYIDPPYVKIRKNDISYLDRYHFLEGLSRYSEWPSLIDSRKQNFCFRAAKSVTEWNHRDRCKERLFDFIATHRRSAVILSYSSGGQPGIEELQKYFRAYFKNVVTLRTMISHALRKNKNHEIIIVGAN